MTQGGENTMEYIEHESCTPGWLYGTAPGGFIARKEQVVYTRLLYQRHAMRMKAAESRLMLDYYSSLSLTYLFCCVPAALALYEKPYESAFYGLTRKVISKECYVCVCTLSFCCGVIG